MRRSTLLSLPPYLFAASLTDNSIIFYNTGHYYKQHYFSIFYLPVARLKLTCEFYHCVKPNVQSLNLTYLMLLNLAICLSVRLFICSLLCLSGHRLLVWLFVVSYAYLSVWPPACLPVRPSVHLSNCPWSCLSVCVCVCLSVCQSVHLPVCPSARLSTHPTNCLSVCLSSMLCIQTIIENNKNFGTFKQISYKLVNFFENQNARTKLTNKNCNNNNNNTSGLCVK